MTVSRAAYRWTGTTMTDQIDLGDPHTVPGRHWNRLDDGRVQCDVSPRFCRLHEGQRGLCFVRARVDDQIVLTSYGRSSGFCVDPVEKKPLNHFLPGSSVLSFGTAGCNLACKFCQNWDISKSREIDTLADAASPETLAAAAVAYGCRSVAFTYNDPTIFLEYAADVADACREVGVKSVAVSAGYIRPDARRDLYAHMDAANIDLKAFTEDFYHRVCSGHLRPVLDTLEYLHFRVPPGLQDARHPADTASDAHPSAPDRARKRAGLRLHRQRARQRGRHDVLPLLPAAGGGARLVRHPQLPAHRRRAVLLVQRFRAGRVRRPARRVGTSAAAGLSGAMRTARPATAGRTRMPAAADRFYPGDPEQLARMVDSRLFSTDVDAHSVGEGPACPRGPARRLPLLRTVRCVGVRLLRGRAVDRVVLIGAAHFVPRDGCAVSRADNWLSPLGPVRVDAEARRIALDVPGVQVDDAPHLPEHAIEVQLPFLQRLFEDPPRVLPVAVHAAPDVVADLLDAVATGPSTLVVASTDLSHYLPDGIARRQDARTAAAIRSLGVSAVDDTDACGAHSLRGLLAWARRSGFVPEQVALGRRATRPVPATASSLRVSWWLSLSPYHGGSCVSIRSLVRAGGGLGIGRTARIDSRPRDDGRLLAFTAALMLGLAAWNNVLVTRLPDHPAWYVVANFAVAARLLVVARWASLSWEELA